MVHCRPISFNTMKLDITQRAVSVKSFFEKLLSVPRGFKKFYPESSGGSGPKAKTSGKARKEHSGGGKDGGKGGGKRGNKDPFDNNNMASFGPLLVGTGLVGALLYLLEQSTRGYV